jgi:hypothetical protein
MRKNRQPCYRQIPVLPIGDAGEDQRQAAGSGYLFPQVSVNVGFGC